MKFTKLRLVGFKSFVEPTEFRIESGLTGVVGPNGCGKSNLVEALRWVMGETSYKNMRASGMDDVIFSGSGGRPSRNTADVTLFLDNQDRQAPAAFNDADHLEISRRIEREAGSVYRVNGRDVRARDVQTLFADASTGSRSPAMVRQGQIGELIAAKPPQRRAIIEEAAGISGLHSRRGEAEIRLRAAEQNLERLEDVLTELAVQLETLKRQARQAARYRLLSADIRSTEAALGYLTWIATRDQVGDAQSALADADRLVHERTEIQARTARDQAVAAHALPGLREGEAAAAAALQRLRLAANEIEAEDRRVRERLADVERRLAQLREDRAREDRMAAETGEATARLEAEAEALAREDGEAAARAGELAARLSRAEAQLAASEERFASLQREAAEATARRSAIDRTLNELTARAQRASARIAESEREQERLDALARTLPDASKGRAGLDEANAAVRAAEDGVVEAERSVIALRAAADATRAPLAEAEREAGRIDTEARTLARMLNLGSAGLWPPVVDAISVHAGLEAALGAALGEDLDASMDTGAPVHWGAAPVSAGDPILPSGAEPLATHVRAPDGLSRRLAQIGLVARADGPRLQGALAVGQRLVSREGDLWRWDGFTAAADAPTPAAQRLAARNRLAELEGLAAEARRLVGAKRAALDTAAAALGGAEHRERAARESVRMARSRADIAREAFTRAERARADLASRQATVSDALARLGAERAEIDEAVTRTEAQRAALPPTRALEEALADQRATTSVDRAAVTEARAASQSLAREAELRTRRMDAIQREQASWIARAGNAQAQIDVLDQRKADAEAEQASLAARPGELVEIRRRLLGEIETAEVKRAAAADACAVADKALSEADRAARAAMEAMSSAREAKVRSEERAAAAVARAREIEAKLRESFDVPAAKLGELGGLKPGAVLPDLEGLERRAERLRQERERLGGVNLRADDEAREVEARRDSMISERDDLAEAIKRLRQGIHNLNREARERLMAAFEVVNGHFQALFTHLFGGGSAELQLVESDDPLEAGLEILARPPGKKPATMTLLSGGEQALTALALIFAVFLTNPAPICVLDEVDAPLDDANVERYCDLLADMAGRTETRFVVITHNPITMARMDRLYGVTMAERGVSQLVSVDLQVAERFMEAG